MRHLVNASLTDAVVRASVGQERTSWVTPQSKPRTEKAREFTTSHLWLQQQPATQKLYADHLIDDYEATFYWHFTLLTITEGWVATIYIIE